MLSAAAAPATLGAPPARRGRSRDPASLTRLGAAAAKSLDEIYAALCDLLNFYMPVRRSTGERRENGRTARRCEPPATPCERLFASDALDAEGKRRLAARRDLLDPEELNERIDAALDALERLER